MCIYFLHVLGCIAYKYIYNKEFFNMGSLKRYIAESILSEKNNVEANADLIYQKVLDVLDHAHIDFSDTKIEFHIGRIIKNSDIDIDMVIRSGESDSVRLGKNKQKGDYTIVVDVTSDLPLRSEIDAFLAKDRTRALAIKSIISKYLSDKYLANGINTVRTKYEEDASYNKAFEHKYEAIISKLKDLMEEVQGTISELKSEMDTEDTGKRETCKRAMKSVIKDSFGDNFNEFKKVVNGMMKDAGDLSKENKEKLYNRLESFYDQRIKPLLEK